jgi:palmitoyltransferase
VYTFSETLLDISVLLPSFITYFQDESRRSNSASDIAILFIAFGKPRPWKHQTYIEVVRLYLPYLHACLAVLNLVFALSLLCFLGINMPLVLSNTTSIEVRWCTVNSFGSLCVTVH